MLENHKKLTGDQRIIKKGILTLAKQKLALKMSWEEILKQLMSKKDVLASKKITEEANPANINKGKRYKILKTLMQYMKADF